MPPVKWFEVGEYQDLAGRSRNDGMDIDHIPSKAALREYLIRTYGEKIQEQDMGEPNSVGSPEKIPVIGIVGGYDSYTHKLSEQYPNTEIRFLYLADLRGHALIFEHFA
ncbi:MULTISPECIES: hypothetical protein [Photorhabdus]|uniref:hypothetical protein n=1 Tax=Photorhabdus TaxID=29487 RepID=UPI0002E9A2E7|nr:hypothetical protein [Photorhabdus asymbiotica]